MNEVETSTITLRALRGEPLRDEQVRNMVIANAHAIAERHGIAVSDVTTTPTSVTATLRAGRIEAMGFAAELRRMTTNWYRHKFGEPTLWGDVDDAE
jgi:hypothetical protein